MRWAVSEKNYSQRRACRLVGLDPQDRNLRWSLDFVMDTLVNGRRFRILTVVDDFTREFPPPSFKIGFYPVPRHSRALARAATGRH